ncbi:MAG: hypothetical protein MUP11_07895 [Anaerolineales bacterium]|nr:hypothetical protein [Anaerolineales bacterium]
MSETTQNPSPPKKKRSWCCAGCLLLPVISIACLASAYFIGPPLASWLGIFGPEAKEVYEAAPDLAASESLTNTFEELGIPGVRVYVIPIKDQPTQGAFIILDASAGYQGLDPLNEKDDKLLLILQDITRRNRTENLRLAHVTVDFRDENGETATAFTADQELVEDYADGLITQKGFFGQIEIDFLGTLEYLGIDGLLEVIQQ